MAFETVICDVVYRASQTFTDSEGRPNGKNEVLGDFETRREAEQELADKGFTRTDFGWRGNYVDGSVSRILFERKEGAAYRYKVGLDRFALLVAENDDGAILNAKWRANDTVVEKFVNGYWVKIA